MKSIHRKIIRLQVAKVDKLIGEIIHWRKTKTLLYSERSPRYLFTTEECRKVLESWGVHAVPAAHKDAMRALSDAKKCKTLRKLIKIEHETYGGFYWTKVVLLGALGIYPQFVLDEQK